MRKNPSLFKAAETWGKFWFQKGKRYEEIDPGSISSGFEPHQAWKAPYSSRREFSFLLGRLYKAPYNLSLCFPNLFYCYSR
jgi:hypothetical protein